MIKLFLRNYVLFILIILGVILSVNFFADAIDQYLSNANAKLVSKGVFNLVQDRLAHLPQSQWQAYLKAMQPKNGNALSLVPLKALAADFPDKNALLAGKIISGPTPQNGYTAVAAYQRINHSNYALKLNTQRPEIEQYQQNSAWMRVMIQHTLANTPKSAWPSALNKLQQAFKAPVKLLPLNTLTPLAQQQLRKWQVAFTEHDGGSIATISFLAPDQQHVVVLGPLKDIVLLRYETYAFIGVALLLLFVSPGMT